MEERKERGDGGCTIYDPHLDAVSHTKTTSSFLFIAVSSLILEITCFIACVSDLERGSGWEGERDEGRDGGNFREAGREGGNFWDYVSEEE